MKYNHLAVIEVDALGRQYCARCQSQWSEDDYVLEARAEAIHHVTNEKVEAVQRSRKLHSIMTRTSRVRFSGLHE